jgi:predicted KAP-like P-loop ATPase
MQNESKKLPELGSDLPLADPAQDAFGYASFATRLADAIINSKSPQGLVLAVHGKWGSGKSTLLNFIKHDLRSAPQAQRPVLVDFNPWWFEGREQIASQLLEQFSAQLPDRLKHVRSLAKVIGKYSQQIASAAADYSGYGWIKKPVAWALGWIPALKFLREPTGIPQMKKRVAEALKASGRRFVFFVDDIDRLTPDEARDLFRAIKALADFPEVVYVLFFDREEVGRALTATLKMDGDAYLEKIIQAPFHLPAVDPELLQKKLFEGLDAIIESHSMPFAFDQGRWAEVFQDGIRQCVRKPRDVVRIHNALSVSYPPLAGEVNPVDFIALEFIRVFEPGAYGSIRDGREFFCGSPTSLQHRQPAEKAYFEKWRDQLPPEKRDWLVSMVGRLFPKVALVLDADFLVSGDESDWRRELRPCSPECFDPYFQLDVPRQRVSRAELERLIGEQSPEAMSALLLEAKDVVFPDGHSKARDLIDRVRDLDNLNPEQSTRLVKALVASSQRLLRKEDERGGFFSLPNRWRILGLVTKLLERLDVEDRQQLLASLAADSEGLWALVGLADFALEANRDSSKAPEALRGFEEGFAQAMSATVGKRLDDARLDQLLDIPELDYVVHRWSKWGNPARIHEVFKPMVDDDEKLLVLLDKFVRTGLSSSGNKTSEIYLLSMVSLGTVMDLQAAAPRVRGLQARSGLTVRQRAAIARFLRGLERMSEGKDPDGLYLDDFDD